MILLRSLRRWNGPRRIHGLLALGYAAYGLGTVLLFATFLVAGVSVTTFLRDFSALLLLVGILLATDGILSIVTGIDRTGERILRGRGALVPGSFKAAAAMIALLLALVGSSLS